MRVKLFEIRDRGTFIPALAVHLFVDGAPIKSNLHYEAELFLLRRVGYSLERILFPNNDEPYIILSKLDGVEANYDPFCWNSHTMQDAHLHIIKNWKILRSGDVIDAEFLRNETNTPKVSERFS